MGEERARKRDGDKESRIYAYKNVGDQPVKILELRKDCGCMMDEITAQVVHPGKTETLKLSMPIPLMGERKFNFELVTDSPITPRVRGSMILDSDAKPPYVLKVNGDLLFDRIESYTEGISFNCQTIQRADDSTNPKPVCDLGSSSIELEGSVDIDHPDHPGLVLRTTNFRLKFTGPPSSEAGDGTVVISDPWTPNSSSQSLNVRRRLPRRLEILPRYVKITGAASEARFFIRLERTNWAVKPRDLPEASPFVVEQLGEMLGDRLRQYRLALRKGVSVQPGTYEVSFEGTGAGESAVSSLTIFVVGD